MRASTAWLEKVLRRRDFIDGTPLRRAEVDIVRRRVIQPVEVGWYGKLEYFIEGYKIGRPNLQGGANMRLPFRSGRARASVAAASRRSP